MTTVYVSLENQANKTRDDMYESNKQQDNYDYLCFKESVNGGMTKPIRSAVSKR